MSRISEVVNNRSPEIIYILFGDELYLNETQIFKFIEYVKKNNNNNCWHLLTNIKKEDKTDKNVVKCKLNKKKKLVIFVDNIKINMILNVLDYLHLKKIYY